MTDIIQTFDLPYGKGSGAPTTTLHIEGRGSDTAFGAIRAALARDNESSNWSSFSLSSRSVYDPDSPDDEFNNQFLLIHEDATLDDLRLLVGPVDDRVVLHAGGFGGPSEPELMFWFLNDLLPFGRVALEAWGAVEVARTVGRVIERRPYRQSRRDAEHWARTGMGELPVLLKDEVEKRKRWTTHMTALAFDLSASETSELMSRCGYEFDAGQDAYLAVWS
jgi:hypothetical protein